jgi:hypothetical protein
MSRPEKEENWHQEAVELMVRNGISLKAAAIELGQEVTSQEADVLLRRRSFNRRLWEERHRYYTQLGNSPNFKKETVIGKLLDLAQKLEDEGKADKAGTLLFQAAKIAGFVGPDSTVTVFGELSAKDLDAIRETVAKKASPLPN